MQRDAQGKNPTQLERHIDFHSNSNYDYCTQKNQNQSTKGNSLILSIFSFFLSIFMVE